MEVWYNDLCVVRWVAAMRCGIGIRLMSKGAGRKSGRWVMGNGDDDSLRRKGVAD